MTQRSFSFEQKVPCTFSLKKSQVDFIKEMVDSGLYANTSECVSTMMDIFIESAIRNREARETMVQQMVRDFEVLASRMVLASQYQEGVSEHQEQTLPPTPTNEVLVDRGVLSAPKVATENERSELIDGIINIAQKRNVKVGAIINEWCEGREDDFNRAFKGNKAYLVKEIEKRLATKSQETFNVPTASKVTDADRKESRQRHIDEAMESLPGKIYAHVMSKDENERSKILKDEILPSFERIHRLMNKPEREPFITIMMDGLQPLINERYLTDANFEYEDAAQVIMLAAKRVTSPPKQVKETPARVEIGA